MINDPYVTLLLVVTLAISELENILKDFAIEFSLKETKFSKTITSINNYCKVSKRILSKV